MQNRSIFTRDLRPHCFLSESRFSFTETMLFFFLCWMHLLLVVFDWGSGCRNRSDCSPVTSCNISAFSEGDGDVTSMSHWFMWQIRTLAFPHSLPHDYLINPYHTQATWNRSPKCNYTKQIFMLHAVPHCVNWLFCLHKTLNKFDNYAVYVQFTSIFSDLDWKTSKCTLENIRKHLYNLLHLIVLSSSL